MVLVCVNDLQQWWNKIIEIQQFLTDAVLVLPYCEKQWQVYDLFLWLSCAVQSMKNVGFTVTQYCWIGFNLVMSVVSLVFFFLLLHSSKKVPLLSNDITLVLWPLWPLQPCQTPLILFLCAFRAFPTCPVVVSSLPSACVILLCLLLPQISPTLCLWTWPGKASNILFD